MIKRPLMWITIAYILGILLARWKEIYSFFIILFILFGIILLLTVWKISNQYINKKDGFLFFIPIIIFLGITITKNQMMVHPMDAVFDDKINGSTIGIVYMIEDKGDKRAIYLKDNTILLNIIDSSKQNKKSQSESNISSSNNYSKILKPINLKIENLENENLKTEDLKTENLKPTNLKLTNQKSINHKITNLKPENLVSNSQKPTAYRAANLDITTQKRTSLKNLKLRTSGLGTIKSIMSPHIVKTSSTTNLNQKYNKYQYTSNRMIVYTSDTIHLKVGNEVRVEGKIIKFQKATNLGQFDEYHYNKIKKIDYKMYSSNIAVINTSYSKFANFLQRIKEKLSLTYKTLLNKKEAGIILAMLLGEKTLLDVKINELYQVNGISHILSISGLHVSFIGLFIYKLLNKLGLKQILSTGIAIIFIYCYGLLTNFSVSTNRAIVMLIVSLLAKIFGKTYDLLTATSLSALIILVQSPLQVYDGGFLLSFSAMLSFAIPVPIFQLLLEHDIAESESNSSFKSSTKISKLTLKSKLRPVLFSLITSFSVNLLSLPILLYFFFQFPPYSVLINLIIIPIMSLLLLLAMLGGVIGCYSLIIGRFLIGGVHYILVFSELICNIFSEFPFHLITVGKPDWIKIVYYYSILFVFFIIAYRFKKRKSIYILLLLVFFFLSHHNKLEITFLDVSQGDAIFIRTPNHVTYLIDGGSSNVSNVGQYRMEPFLKASGVGVLDYAIVTHTDEDHISGLKELLIQSDKNGVRIKYLVLPNTNLKDDSYLSLVETAKSHNVKTLYLKKGDVFQEKDLSITCLHPSLSYQTEERNDYSTVLSLSYHNYDMLLTGDLGEEPEKLLIDLFLDIKNSMKHNNLSVNHKFGYDQKVTYGQKVAQGHKVAYEYEVLKVAHHGSRYSTLEDFLEIVKPEISVISCGKDNKYGHPHAETLQRLKEQESNVLLTTECGAITIRTDGRNMVITKFMDEK